MNLARWENGNSLAMHQKNKCTSLVAVKDLRNSYSRVTTKYWNHVSEVVRAAWIEKSLNAALVFALSKSDGNIHKREETSFDELLHPFASIAIWRETQELRLFVLPTRTRYRTALPRSSRMSHRVRRQISIIEEKV